MICRSHQSAYVAEPSGSQLCRDGGMNPQKLILKLKWIYALQELRGDGSNVELEEL